MAKTDIHDGGCALTCNMAKYGIDQISNKHKLTARFPRIPDVYLILTGKFCGVHFSNHVRDHMG